mgnify:CR=1 FL=1
MILMNSGQVLITSGLNSHTYCLYLSLLFFTVFQSVYITCFSLSFSPCILTVLCLYDPGCRVGIKEVIPESI